jgi:hypothetical protein
VESTNKAEKVRSTSSNSKSDLEEILELNSEGDIVRKEEAVKEPTPRVGHKNYVSTRQGDKSDFLGYSHKLPEAPLTTLLGKDGLKCSDDELRTQSLVAWRHHLRTHGRYRPDKALPRQTHEAHAKILMSALSNFKNERIKCQLSRRAKLFFKHPQYSMMYKSYHVPEESCSPYELMSKVDKDRDIIDTDVRPSVTSIACSWKTRQDISRALIGPSRSQEVTIERGAGHKAASLPSTPLRNVSRIWTSRPLSRVKL